MLQKYPSPQMIKQMIDGKLPLPSADDPLTRAAAQTAIARYEKKKGTDDAAPAPMQPASPAGRMTAAMLNDLPLDSDQKSDLLNGTQETRLDLLSERSMTNSSQFSMPFRRKSATASPTPVRPRCAAA